MERNTKKLIDELSADLEPVRRPGAAGRYAGLWLAAVWPLVVGITLALGPMRPDWIGPLMTTPRYTLEGLLGLSAGIAAVFAALRLGTPSATPARTLALPAFGLFSAWAGLVLYGVFEPALEPSMFGKRPHCVVETFAYSLPAIAIGLYLLRQRATLERRPAIALLAAASASVPALLMQFACMYDPWHTLTLHIGPVIVVTAVAALIGERLLPKV